MHSPDVLWRNNGIVSSGLSDKAFPRSAGPCCVYKPCYPLKHDGDLKSLLQSKPSEGRWRHGLLLHSKGEKKCANSRVKTKARAETKGINPSLLPGSVSNLFVCLGTVVFARASCSVAV